MNVKIFFLVHFLQYFPRLSVSLTLKFNRRNYEKDVLQMFRNVDDSHSVLFGRFGAIG